MIITDCNQNIKEIENRFCKKHYQELKLSGLTDEAIISTGHYTQPKMDAELGIKHTGMVFNYLNPVTGKPYQNSKGKPWIRIKPDDWGTTQRDSDDEPPKYLSQSDEGNRPYFSSCFSVAQWQKIIKSSRHPLIITEGEKKSDCACSKGHPTIGLAGVYGWVDSCPREGESELTDSRPIPELNIVNWKNRTSVLAFDSDVIHKIPVRIALFELAKWLKEQGAEPYICLLPMELDGSKNGIDDFIVRHGVKAFDLLLKFSFPALVTGGKTPSLNLPTDPSLPVKVAMCYSVLKDSWAYRPGMGWYRWNGKHWQSKDNGKGTQFDDDLIRFMNEQGWQKQEGKDLNSLVRHLKAKLLIEDWNPQHLIAFTNGTLNSGTGEFVKEHRRHHYLTSQLPYDFDVSAQCPNWAEFLKSALGDQEAVELLQAFIKWILTPKQQDRPAEIEKCLDLIGQPGTGKGTVLDVIQGLVGNDNCASIERGVFEGGAKLASLVDKKVSIDFDASGFIENLGLFAKIVSNEPVQIKRLYNDVYSGRLNTVIVRAYNRFLEVPSGSECLDRRIIAMHFNNVPEVPDPELKGKLRTELPGIFQWAWQLSASECKHRLLWAGSCTNVAEASIRRFEANNPEFTFLQENYPDGAEGLKLRELYKQYKEWSVDCGLKPTRERKFFETIQLLGAELNGKSMGYKTYTIPTMKDFDVIRHLRLIPKQGDSREIRFSLDDSQNSRTESDREIGRNEGVKINIESSEKPVPSTQPKIPHDHPLKKWLVKVPKAREVNTVDGRVIQIPEEYPGIKASREVNEPLAIRNAIINDVQTREDWDALCTKYDEVRCRWVFYFMVPKDIRNALIPILRGDVKQLTIFTPNPEHETSETPASKEVELTLNSESIQAFRSELRVVKTIATQAIVDENDTKEENNAITIEDNEMLSKDMEKALAKGLKIGDRIIEDLNYPNWSKVVPCLIRHGEIISDIYPGKYEPLAIVKVRWDDGTEGESQVRFLEKEQGESAITIPYKVGDSILINEKHLVCSGNVYVIAEVQENGWVAVKEDGSPNTMTLFHEDFFSVKNRSEQKPVLVQDLPLDTIVRHKKTGCCSKIFMHKKTYMTVQFVDGSTGDLGYFDVEPLSEFVKRLQQAIEAKKQIRLKAKKHAKHPFASTSSTQKYGTILEISPGRGVAIVMTDKHGLTEFYLEAIEVIE